MDKFKQNPLVKKLGFNRVVLIGVLILLYAVFCVAIKNFWGLSHIMSIFNYVYFLGFLSLGVTFVIATGGIDFSIGPVMFACALVAGNFFSKYGLPMGVCLVISVLVGFVFGMFNGYMVAYQDIPPFIISMASMNIAKGAASIFTQSIQQTFPQGDAPGGWFRNLARFNGIPTGLIIFAIVAGACAIILNNTKAGRYILCLGSNKEAVRLSGVNTKKWQMLAYVICGILVGCAAIFFVACYTTVQPNYGDQYNNEAIAGCVMGGTSMAGGLASISGTVIGVLIISLVQEGILALKLTKDYQLIITGIIVIAAVYADVVARRRKN